MTEKGKDTVIDKNHLYYDQALSWLSFNHRVLLESLDKDLPVFEKIKFLAFHQSNLDKFFRTAVSTYKILYKLSKKHIIKLDFSPKETLKCIYTEINK
jgi:polyphosphate kinase